MKYIFLFLILNIYSSDKTEQFLRGSIVKSDEWIIDKKSEKEIFKKNVSFKNLLYTMKTDYAVYDRNLNLWICDGNVYIRRELDNNSYIESYSEKAKYNENEEISILFSSNGRVKTVFYDGIRNETFTSYSKTSTAFIKEKKLIMENEFELITSSFTALSNNAIYYEDKKEFELTEDSKMFGFNEEYITYITAKIIYINREDKTAKAFDRVYGRINRKKI